MENVYTLTDKQVETGIYCIHLEIKNFPQTYGIIVYVFFCCLVTTMNSDVILGITLLKSQIFLNQMLNAQKAKKLQTGSGYF